MQFAHQRPVELWENAKLKNAAKFLHSQIAK